MKDQNDLDEQARELAQHLGIDEQDIKERLRYLSLTHEDIGLIKRLSEAAKGQDTAYLWDHFYAHLQGFEKSNRFLTSHDRLKQLKLTQNRHFLELLAGNYDLDFFLSRLKVGIRHDQVGIDYCLYSGA
ncbi:MAG: protoglobin domain-containing protein [Dissulfurimicrobium sp.]